MGGFVETYSSWRVIFWSTSGLQCITIGICFLCYKETHLPTIVKVKQRQVDGTQRQVWQAPLDFLNACISSTTWKLVYRSLLVPFRQLLTHRSVQIQAIMSGFEYGILYLVLSTYSSLFTTQYHQSVAISGLHYFAICIGEIIGSQIGGRAIDALGQMAKRWTKADSFRPEFHLPVIAPGVLVAAFGFLMYGWAAQRRLHWFVVDVGATIVSGGMQMTGRAMSAYNIDSYPQTRASTTAAIQPFRSLSAFALPLAGPPMYASLLGYGWSNTLLGCLYVFGYCSATWYLWKNGEKLRAVTLM